MNILVIGGTRFFGIHMVNRLIADGHEVTIATRDRNKDNFGNKVKRIVFDRLDVESIKNNLCQTHYDLVIDKIAYCSNDIKSVLDNVICDKYIYMSSTAVYNPKHVNTVESDFDAFSDKVVWCDRADFPYDQIKRQAEYALSQKYADKNWIAVRYPFVIGKDDYTKRLQFYVEHTMKSIPMNIDNIDCQMGFIRSDEAGDFIAYLANKNVNGAINGCAHGTISIKEIIAYVEERTGTKAVIDKNGEAAPYNGEPEYSINTDKAQSINYEFSTLKEWIYELIDYYIDLCMNL